MVIQRPPDENIEASRAVVVDRDDADARSRGKLVRFFSGARRLLFGDYEEQRRWWRTAAAPEGKSLPETTVFVQRVLEAQLERARAAVRSIETKAALVIPAIGVVVGIVGSEVSSSVSKLPLLLTLWTLVVLAGISAVVLAVLALWPRTRSNGPPAQRAVKGIVEEEEAARVNYVKSLGFAVHSEEESANDKGTLLKWSLTSFGAGVLLLLVFAGLGGLK